MSHMYGSRGIALVRHHGSAPRPASNQEMTMSVFRLFAEIFSEARSLEQSMRRKFRELSH